MSQDRQKFEGSKAESDAESAAAQAWKAWDRKNKTSIGSGLEQMESQLNMRRKGRRIPLATIGRVAGRIIAFCFKHS